MTKLGLVFCTIGLILAGSQRAKAAYTQVPYQLDVLSWGAKCDGVTNDRTAFLTGSANGGVVVSFGDCAIASNLTVSSPVTFMQKGMVKPGNGVTVTFTGDVTAPAQKICDTSAGGHCDFTGVKSGQGAVEWWGATADSQNVIDGGITSGLAVLTSSSGLFQASDVGKLVTVAGAGSAAATIASFNTNGTTSAGSRTLHAASTTGVLPGQLVLDLTTSGIIPVGALVESVTSTTVVISNPVVGAGVGNGDIIHFNSFATDLTTTISGFNSPSSVNLAASAGATVSGSSVWWGTDNTGAISEAFLYSPYNLALAANSCYQVTGLIYTKPNHRLSGVFNSNSKSCLVGSGLDFAFKSSMPGDMFIQAHKYVLQNGVGNSAGYWIFDNLQVVGSDLATVIAWGQLWTPSTSLTWEASARDSQFNGYVGWQLQWWNGGYTSNNAFEGTFAGFAKSMPSGLVTSGVVQKHTSVADQFLQSGGTPTAGYGVYEQSNTGGTQYSASVFDTPSIENVYSTIRFVGQNYTVNSLHAERITDTTHPVIVDQGSVVWNQTDNAGFTDFSAQFLSGLGSSDVVNGCFGGVCIGANQPITFGFGVTSPEILGGQSSPNTVLSAPAGSVFLDHGTPEVWKNCGGSTTWVNINSGSC